MLRNENRNIYDYILKDVVFISDINKIIYEHFNNHFFEESMVEANFCKYLGIFKTDVTDRFVLATHNRLDSPGLALVYHVQPENITLTYVVESQKK